MLLHPVQEGIKSIGQIRLDASDLLNDFVGGRAIV
jgi:hypothetical protein